MQPQQAAILPRNADQTAKITKHVGVLVFPSSSHPSTLLNLVRRLAAASPTVLFSFFITAKYKTSLFSAGPTNESLEPNIKPYEVDDGLPEGYTFVFKGNEVEPISLFLKGAVGRFRQALETAVEESGGKEIGCLISDAILYFGGEISEELRIPWIPVFNAGPRALLFHLETDLIRQWFDGRNTDSDNYEAETLDFLPGFSKIQVGDLMEEVLQERESVFSTALHKMGQTLHKAAALVINSFEELDPIMLIALKLRFQHFLSIGPLSILTAPLSSQPGGTIKDEHGCLEWLDKQKTKSVAYISFGNFAIPTLHEVGELAEALEESGIPFLWSFRGNPDDMFPNGFLERVKERGKLVPWAPQVHILRHGSVGLFLSHGGMNSIWESILGAVPMICRPFVADQKVNARSIEVVWEIGIELEGRVLTKSGVNKALELILLSPKGVELRKNIGVLKDLLLKAVSSEGSSTINFNVLVEIVST